MLTVVAALFALPGPGASAGTACGSVSFDAQSGFSPPLACPAGGLGGTVTWTFNSNGDVTASPDYGVGLDSGPVTAPGQFQYTANYSGTFSYQDSSTGDQGQVKVPLVAKPASGDPATAVTISVAAPGDAIPAGDSYDVLWAYCPSEPCSPPWQTLTSGLSGTTTSTQFVANAVNGGATGTYLFRSMLNGVAATTSPSRAVAISSGPSITSLSSPQGVVGDTISIFGTDLSTATRITFNGTPARKTWSVASLGAELDNVEVPIGATTGPVVVQTGDGSTNGVPFAVIQAPTITAPTPAAGGPGTRVVLSGSHFTGTTAVSVGNGSRSPVASFTLVSDTEIDLRVPPTAPVGSASISVVNKAGKGTTPFTVDPGIPTVNPFPRWFATHAPFTVSWKAPGTGATAYHMTWQAAPWNGGFGHPSAPLTVSTTHTAFTGSMGHEYCFRVQALGPSGTTPSAYSRSQCVGRPLDDRSLAPSKGWVRGTGKGFYGNTYSESTTRGATLTLKGVRARKITVFFERLPGGGSFSVWFNGSLLHSAVSTASGTTLKLQSLPVLDSTTLRTGTLVIRVTSARHPVVIDAVGIRNT